MKNNLMVSLSLAALTLSTVALAQDGKSGSGDVAGKTGRPASLNIGTGNGMGNFLSFLFHRIHTLDIAGQAQEMQKDGVSERKYIAVFGASGAIVYQHELDADNVDLYNDTGRNVGLQIVPYTIKYSTDGKVYLAMNPLSMKNMIALQSGKNYWRGDYGSSSPAGFFQVIDNIDFLVLKWDKGMNFDNYESFTLDIVNTDLKLDVLNSSKSTRYLALTAGGSFGAGKGDLTLDSGEVIRIGTYEDDAGLSFRSQFRYGLEYSDQWQDGSRLNVKVGAQHTNQNGYFLDKDKVASANQQNTSNAAQFEINKNRYNVDIVTYTNDKKAYEQANLNGSSISDESYKTLTGKNKPVSPSAPKTITAEKDQIVRQQIYLTPSIEFSKQINDPRKRPVRMGMGLNANIPLRDTFQGGKVNLNMQNNNRNLINARIFINF